jgi:hypothetical protein
MIGIKIGITKCHTQVGSDFTRKCQAGLKKPIRIKHSNLFCSITRHCVDSGRLWLCTQKEYYLRENALAYSAADEVRSFIEYRFLSKRNFPNDKKT